MEAREVSAKTVEEAVELALNEMGLDRSEVEIEVLQEGKRGILGWGGEEALVKVIPLTPTGKRGTLDSTRGVGSDTESGLPDNTAKEVVEQLLSLMQVSATVEVRQPEDSESPLTLDIDGDDPGILIGRRGQSLSALQYMVNFVASRKHQSGVRVIVDVAGYRKRRQDELQNMALRVADTVKSNGRSVMLEPMLAWERRAVHITLRDSREISTGSVGTGDRRKVVISLNK
ncbi:MAG: protein jag [Chloroflexi bacterium]|jgi:spoIIIJ-associated protein|nr:protein jag [Chloroflexota bacterium]